MNNAIICILLVWLFYHVDLFLTHTIVTSLAFCMHAYITSLAVCSKIYCKNYCIAKIKCCMHNWEQRKYHTTKINHTYGSNSYHTHTKFKGNVNFAVSADNIHAMKN